MRLRQTEEKLYAFITIAKCITLLSYLRACAEAHLVSCLWQDRIKQNQNRRYLVRFITNKKIITLLCALLLCASDGDKRAPSVRSKNIWIENYYL